MSVNYLRTQFRKGAVLLLTMLLVSVQIASAQGKGTLVKGRITDYEGQPVAGATVQNLTEKTYTTTDADGNYSLNVKDLNNATFEVAIMGMETVTQALGGRTSLDVQMKPDQMFLEGSVVTGYQEIQQRKVTGAISTVSSKTIEERYSPSILQNLEGRVAGLSTYGGELKIRGVSSMYAEASPLLVVDGLPIEGDIDDLNPYDIESVNVLKDAAAAAIYGARASNGIIVITTKSAREKGRIDVDFSSNLTIYQMRNLDYGANFYMTPAQQVKVEKDYYQYYFNTPEEIADPITSIENSLANFTNRISPIEYAFYKQAKGEYSQADVDNICNSLANNNFAKEFGDAVYRRQIMQQYNLALRSRSDKFQSNFVINYLSDNEGTINAFDRQMSISYKGSYDVAPWLTATVAVNGIYGKQRSKGSSATYGPWSYPAYESLTNEDGSVKLLNTNLYRDNTEEGVFKELGVNLVDEYYNNVQNTSRQYMRYHGDLLFKIAKGLTANTQFVYETDHRTTDWQANQESYLSKLFYNAYKEIDPETGMITYHTPETGGYRNVTNMDGRYWTARGQLNYSETFGKHEIVALAGLEFRETLYAGTRSLMLGYDDQLQNAATQMVNFGELGKMTNSPSYLPTSSGGGYPALQMVFNPYIDGSLSPIMEQHHRYASAYANFTYTYDRRYNVFGSYRKDYADVYGLNVKLRGRPLWSAGVAWNIGEEDFAKASGWINTLKLRLSYGITGNIYQGATSYMTAKSDELNTLTGLPYGYIESPANPNLKWEQTRTINAGLDFSFVDNRIRGSLDYYRKTGLDLFSYKTLDPTTGFTQMFVNSADMTNNGVELMLVGDWFRERRRRDFGWSSTVTFAVNKNKITNVDNPAIQAYQRFSNPYVVDYPTSAIWSYEFAGISDAEETRGSTMWYGKVNEETGERAKGTSVGGSPVDILVYSGQTEPIVIAGLDNRFVWNGFSLSILMAYYGGHKMRALAEEDVLGIGRLGALPAYFNNAWTPENKTNTPGIGQYASVGAYGATQESAHSDICVRNASFLKIRNIVFGYEMPEKWARAINADRINLQFQIDNLPPVWTAFRPGKEMSYYAPNAIFDPETGGIPLRSSYIFGLHINF